MYVILKVGFQILVCCLSVVCVAQDSVRVLEEVDIVGIDLSKFSSGTVLQKLEASSSGSLLDIGDNTTIHFKNYGNQQLSTIAFRGTSANHTNVIWNGLQVNSPTLGQTDFSVWPYFLTDQITIQYGGGSSLFGSGAIGGSVIIDNSVMRKDSLLTLYNAYGSFGQYDGGLKFQYEISDRLTIESKGFLSKIENNFPLEGGGRQPHAGVERRGFSQKLNYRYKVGKLFSELAYAENDRQIQPTVTSASRSTLITRNLRGVVNSVFDLEGGKHDITFGANTDETVFNDSIITSSYRVTGTYSFIKDFTPSLQARFGGTILNEFAESENFGDKQRQNQIQLFSSLTFYPMSNLGITTNLREIIFNDTEVFVPSLGAEYILSERINRSILLRGQVSRDFRVPTFNDLFWIPGGNLELRPERSSNAEVGLDFGLEKTTIRFTSFYSDINDWIQWRPINSVWSPRNLRRVKTRGLESFIDTQVPVGQSLLSIAVAYTYVRSEDQSIDERNQLPYVPEHEFFGSLNTILGDYVLGFRGNFTSVRYTTLTNSIQSQVDEFLLFDASIRRSLTLKGVAVECRLNLTNLFDANYQVVKNHAMPGRAFSIELTTKF